MRRSPENEFALLIIVERKVQQDGGCLKNDKIVSRVVDKDGDPPVRVELDEPVLLLSHSRDVDVLETSSSREDVS